MILATNAIQDFFSNRIYLPPSKIKEYSLTLKMASVVTAIATVIFASMSFSLFCSNYFILGAFPFTATVFLAAITNDVDNVATNIEKMVKKNTFWKNTTDQFEETLCCHVTRLGQIAVHLLIDKFPEIHKQFPDDDQKEGVPNLPINKNK